MAKANAEEQNECTGNEGSQRGITAVTSVVVCVIDAGKSCSVGLSNSVSCVNKQKEGALTPAEAWAARSPMPLMQWETWYVSFSTDASW